MKAKDTVVVCMSGGERIEGCSVRCHLAQAEISFKAGYGQHKEESDKALEILEREIQGKLDEERKVGIREVVDIIVDFDSMLCHDFDRKYGVSSTVSHTPKGLLEVLRRLSKLKEWDI